MRNTINFKGGIAGVFLLLSVVFGYGQGGTDCATAIGLPLVLPYNGTNLTNCGSLDDYTAANSVPCGNNLYLGGEEHVYVFQTPTAGPVQITLSSLSTSVGIFLYDNCPDVPGTNCVGNSTTFSGNQQINFTATAGGTYFLTVDSWPGVTCHPAYDLYIGPPLPPNNQDCLGAIPLCQPTYNQPNSFSGEGNVINEIDNTTSCLGSGELNDVWYTFTVQNSGILNFSITPNQLTDDYDWAVYDLTNHNCSDIFTTPALEVSCNFSGNPGITGANGNIAQPQNMPTIPVVAGQVFVLNISNFSSTQFGYVLDFTQSTASIFDQIPPRIDSILGTPLACGRDSIIVRMSENVVCSSVQPADFVLHGPGGPYIVNSVVSQGCTSGSNYDNIYQLSFSPPISGTGSFYMVLQGVVQDICLNNSVVDSLRINIPPYTPFASENRQICLGDTVHLWATGATGYTWTPSNGLSNPNIANPVFTDTVTRTYVVQMAIPCPAIFILDTVTITVLSRPTVEAGPDTFLCQGSGGVQLNALASGGIAPYTYVWRPNGGPISNFNITNPVANPLQDTTFYFYATGFNGCRSNLDSLRVSVVPLPLVNAGFDLSFCKDAPGVFLQGQIINPIGSYRVRWLPQTGLFCDTCLVTYAQPNQTTIYTLRVTELATGCSSDSTTINTQSTALVTVIPRPVGYAGPDTTICLGDSAQLYATVTGAGPNYTYAWAPGYAMVDSSVINPKAAPAYTTIYTLQVNSNGCSSIVDSVYVLVKPVPVVSGGNTKNICQGDSGKLDGFLQQGIAQVYRWTPSAGLSDSTILQPIASPAVSTTYNLRAWNGWCSSLPAPVLVVVHPRPIANAGQDTVICSDQDSIVLQGNYVGGSSPYQVSWSPASGLDFALKLRPTCFPSLSTLYYLTVSSGTGQTYCSSRDSVLVTVVPGVDATLSQDTNIICPGQRVQLWAQGGHGNASFLWSPQLNLTSPISGLTYASPDTTTRYQVVVSEAQCRDTLSTLIRVHPRPIAGFNLSQEVGCAPLLVKANDRSYNAISHSWDFGDGSGWNNSVDADHTYTKAGVYPVKLIIHGIGGCTDTMISIAPIVVTEGMVVDFISDPMSPVELSEPNTEVRFRSMAEGASSWFWDFGDGMYSDQKDPTHQYGKAGTYVVKLIAKQEGGCSGTVSRGPYTVFTPELSVSNVFSPNGDGANDVWKVQYDGDEAFVVEVFDRWGVKYFESRNRNQGWDGRDLNGNLAVEGTYFYVLQIGKGNYTGSLSIIR